jgi:hypothetical protein
VLVERAMTAAEFFRDQGKRVLMVIDDLGEWIRFKHQELREELANVDEKRFEKTLSYHLRRLLRRLEGVRSGGIEKNGSMTLLNIKKPTDVDSPFDRMIDEQLDVRWNLETGDSRGISPGFYRTLRAKDKIARSAIIKQLRANESMPLRTRLSAEIVERFQNKQDHREIFESLHEEGGIEKIADLPMIEHLELEREEEGYDEHRGE